MSEITQINTSFAARDGVNIFTRKMDVENPRAGLVIAHGLGEHSGRYQNMMERLASKQIAVWALDHRGHGQSGGPKGHILHFDQYLMDLQALVETASTELGEERKLFLLGHSMGGLIAISFAIRFGRMIDGLIVSSPSLGMIVEVPAWKSTLGKFMSNVWPGLTMANELDADKISHDKNIVADYDSDPLVHDKVSARWFTEFTGAMEKAQENTGNLNGPVLMQIAGDDHLVRAESSKEFFEKLTCEDKEIYLYDSLYHEIYNEVESDREKVLIDLEDWIERHIS